MFVMAGALNEKRRLLVPTIALSVALTSAPNPDPEFALSWHSNWVVDVHAMVLHTRLPI
jgi:hypothetical protein